MKNKLRILLNKKQAEIDEIGRRASRLTINNLTGEGSTSDAAERKKFIRKCPMNECKGFLSSQWKCGLCETKICNKCNEEKLDTELDPDGAHMCKPENVASMELLNKDTKPCPSCGTMICKISGCDQMWCPECHTAFSWNKGTIEKGVVHNPHYYDFMRNMCSTISNKIKIIKTNYDNLFPSDYSRFLSSVDFGSLGYSTDALADITASLRMDRCVLVY